MFTYSEENYLKAIFKLSQENKNGITTNAIAGFLATKASSVTDMIQKLANKGFIYYKPYQGVKLTEDGEKSAINILRKHRLWELFLYQYLGFKWNEIHEIAEEMEHIKSDLLIERLDKFMNYPETDPHGDPIPDKDGHFPDQNSQQLSQMQISEKCILTGVKDKTDSFLKYLSKVGIELGTEIEILEWYEFDHSANIKINNKKIIHLSNQVIENILIQKRNG